MTRPYPEELVEIMEEAGTRYDRWLHRPGVRGQMVLPQDGLEYWVAQATWERAIDEAAKVPSDRAVLGYVADIGCCSCFLRISKAITKLKGEPT